MQVISTQKDQEWKKGDPDSLQQNHTSNEITISYSPLHRTGSTTRTFRKEGPRRFFPRIVFAVPGATGMTYSQARMTGHLKGIRSVTHKVSQSHSL